MRVRYADALHRAIGARPTPPLCCGLLTLLASMRR
jgi:hypothetical protein